MAEQTELTLGPPVPSALPLATASSDLHDRNQGQSRKNKMVSVSNSTGVLHNTCPLRFGPPRTRGINDPRDESGNQRRTHACAPMSLLPGCTPCSTTSDGIKLLSSTFAQYGHLPPHTHSYPMQKEYKQSLRNVARNARTGPPLSLPAVSAAAAFAMVFCTVMKARDLGSGTFPSKQRRTNREKPETPRRSSSSSLMLSSGLRRA